MVLVVHTGYSTFVGKDINMLSRHFTALDFHYKARKKLSDQIKNQIELVFWLLANRKRAKGVFVWFADYHSFIPIFFARLFGKPSLLVLGGYDVNNMPEIHYGSFSNPLRAFCTRYSIRYATFVLPVEPSLGDLAIERVKRIQGNIVPIPTGYDPQKWYCDSPKENSVLTVAICDSWARIRLKGIDFFIETARRMPQVQFTIVGIVPEAKKLLSPPANVDLVDKLTLGELRQYYTRAKVYAQFSLHEGLPNAVCEAMLCECVPVGTHAGGIPTAIGDCGFIIEKQDISKAVAVITEALTAPTELGKKARQRIMENFTHELRETRIISLLKPLEKKITSR